MVLAVHIPGNEKLSQQEVDKSFNAVTCFFKNISRKLTLQTKTEQSKLCSGLVRVPIGGIEQSRIYSSLQPIGNVKNLIKV